MSTSDQTVEAVARGFLRSRALDDGGMTGEELDRYVDSAWRYWARDIRAGLSALADQGMVVMPREATDEMVAAAEPAIDQYYDGTKDAPFDGGVTAVYHAMITAYEEQHDG